ncbi:arabinose isomerase, partial [candidate division KSB1 bacterium]|nr:arabinose isomerase [candidate division KSB1 bacterium]
MLIPRRRPLSATVGIYGVGHFTYWAQFDGLYQEMQNKLALFEALIKRHNIKAVNFGISDQAETTYSALPHIKAADLDLLFVDMLTYATSGTIGAIFREINVPIVLVA